MRVHLESAHYLLRRGGHRPWQRGAAEPRNTQMLFVPPYSWGTLGKPIETECDAGDLFSDQPVMSLCPMACATRQRHFGLGYLGPNRLHSRNRLRCDVAALRFNELLCQPDESVSGSHAISVNRVLHRPAWRPSFEGISRSASRVEVALNPAGGRVPSRGLSVAVRRSFHPPATQLGCS